MESMFNLSEEDLKRLCERREVQSDSNQPIYRDRNFLDVCVEGAGEIVHDAEVAKFLRDKMGQGGNVE